MKFCETVCIKEYIIQALIINIQFVFDHSDGF